jgi:hypothetical protein
VAQTPFTGKTFAALEQLSGPKLHAALGAGGVAAATDVKTKMAELDTNIDAVRKQMAFCRMPADTAAGNTWERAIFVAQQTCTILAVEIVPDATIGDGTNYMALDVLDKADDGSGTTSILSGSPPIEINDSPPLDAFDAISFGISGSPQLTADDVLTLKKTLGGGTNEAFPGGLIMVEYEIDIS